MPELLLESRQWEFLHDALCSIAFLSGIITNIGVDKAIDLFDATVMAVRQWPGPLAYRPSRLLCAARY